MVFQELVQPITEFLNSVVNLELIIAAGVAAWFGMRLNASFTGLFLTVSATIFLWNQSIAWDAPLAWSNVLSWVLIHSSLAVFSGFLVGYLAKCGWEKLFEG